MPFVRRVQIPTFQQFLTLWTTRTGVIVLTSGGSTVVRMVSSIILTRLLSPEAFGIIGIIGSIFFVITMLTDLGFQSFLVPHQRGEDRHFRDVIWTIHAVRGFVLAALAALASPAFAWILGKPQLAVPLAVASVVFVFYGLTSFSLITALRQHGARKLAVLDLVLQIGQTIACVLLALVWRNVWAMIAAMIVQSILRMVLSFTWFADSRHAFARDREIYREFLRFSRLILATSVLTLIILQTDKLVLARLFTLEQFGLYAIALSLASAPMSIGDAYMTRVVFPLYAQVWRNTPSALAEVYYRVRRPVSLVFGLGCGAIIGGAHFMIVLLYDPRYEKAALWLSILMISVALRLSNVAASQFMTAKGDIRSTLHVNLVRLAWFAIAIPAGYLTLGALGVVIAVGLVELPAMLYSWSILRRDRLLDLREEFLFLGVIGLSAGLSYAISQALLSVLAI
jgi:O-antigen/teichoic acid export membrane protein